MPAVQALILDAIFVASELAFVAELVVPDSISTPFTLTLLTLLLLLMLVTVMVAPVPPPAPETVIVVVGISARRTLLNTVFAAAPPLIDAVEPIELLHSL
jgi:hypothetical protein